MIGKDQDPGTEREYVLKCKIKGIKQSYYEAIDDKRRETASFVLVPDLEPTDAGMCMDTYLPDVGTICLDCNEISDIKFHKCPECGSERLKNEWTEVPARLGGRVNSFSRLALQRKNSYCDKHHFFVMSSGVEDELKDLEGQEIEIRVMKAEDDYLCDHAPTVDKEVRHGARDALPNIHR